MGLEGRALEAAERTLELEPDSWQLQKVREEFHDTSEKLHSRVLQVQGSQMILVESGKRQVASFEEVSHDGERSEIRTVSSSGQEELQTLTWFSESHFRITDPMDISVEFVRP